MTATNDAPDTPDDYEGRSASAKYDWVWNELLCGTEYRAVDRPDLVMTSPLTMLSIAGRRSALTKALDHTDDVMLRRRPKIIHTRGAAAMVRLETFDDSPYTGILAPAAAGGGARGVMRVSLAVPPIGKGSITPGIGLKFFVDGRPSLDLLAMNHTVGQGRDFNLFSNTFTHDLHYEHEELRSPQKVMSWFFKRVTTQPRRLTCRHFGEYNAAGAAADPIHAPQRLVFVPHRDVRDVYKHAHGDDFRDPLVRNIAADTPLYTVMSVYDEHPDRPDVPVGIIRSDSAFCCSAGGDRLFFRHHIADEFRL